MSSHQSTHLVFKWWPWLLAAGLLIVWLGAQNFLRFDLSVLQVWQVQLQSAYSNNPIAFSLAYFSLFTFITGACLPGASLLMLTCSSCLGFVGGTVISTAASALGALITMLIARYAFQTKVEKRWPKQLQKINHGLEENEIPFLLSLRLAPIIPFIPFNLLAGITSVKSKRFFWTSFIGMLPGTAIYVNAGMQLSEVNSLDDFFSPFLILSFCAMAVVPWLLNWVFKRYQPTQNP